ncbi:MAG: hypothetical protein WCF23_22975 [Candidatus Nitrosopolaris sp.]
MTTDTCQHSLSTVADTVPPKSILPEEMKYHLAKPFNCMICHTFVDKTYHIHKTIVKQSTNNKRNIYAD